MGSVGRQCSLTLYFPTSPATPPGLLLYSHTQGTTLATRSSAQRIQAGSRKVSEGAGQGWRGCPPAIASWPAPHWTPPLGPGTGTMDAACPLGPAGKGPGRDRSQACQHRRLGDSGSLWVVPLGRQPPPHPSSVPSLRGDGGVRQGDQQSAPCPLAGCRGEAGAP